MRIKHFIFLLLVTLMSGCKKDEPYVMTSSENLKVVDNTVFYGSEELSLKKFDDLKTKYQLDTIFHGEEDEFKRILLLRHWIRTVVNISDFEPSYPGDDFAENILDAALKGQGFHCGHYMIVQNAVMNSYGYVTRCLGAGPGVKGGPDGHHGINEIWSNQFQKWFLSDAKYNHHFEKGGVPLSALEIRDEYLKNKAADITLIKGPEKKILTSDGVLNKKGEIVQVTKERFAQTYTWIEWEAVNNRFSYWPDNSDTLSYLNMFADTYFKNNTWIWDGKPHWSYNTKSMIPIEDRKAIEWTPNTVNAKAIIAGDSVSIKLHSSTPNVKTYQMKGPDDIQWRDVSNSPVLLLKGDKNQFEFRVINLADVAGPVHTVVFGKK